MATLSTKKFFGVGKRKTSVARLYITPGEGEIKVNERTFENFFGRAVLRMIIMNPIEVTGNAGKFNIVARVYGGGPAGQAYAIRHALSRALLALNPDYRKPLSKNGFLTRDSRIVERKKTGHRKARKRSQYSKR
ncbi:30S ribosomal protein S9 [bacterium]|nr:30S ribosomal protein S9 [bacterium]